MADIEEATSSEHADAPDKETEQPSLDGAPAEAGEPGPSHRVTPAGSAEGSSGDAANAATSEAANAGASSTMGGADDAGTSTVSVAPPTIIADTSVTVSAGVLPTVGEATITNASQTTVSTDASLAVSTPVSLTAGDTVSTDRSQTMVSTDASQTVGESVSADASQTVGESVSADASQTVGESVSADASQTVGESVSADASQTVGESVHAHASQTVGESVSADASQTVGESVSADASQTVGESVSADASQTVGESVSADASQTVSDLVNTDASLTGEKTACPSPQHTPPAEPPPPEAQEDAEDEMEVNAVKVEEDQLLEGREGMPVISAVEEGSNMDSFSRNSLDEADVDEKMDTGTGAQMNPGTTMKEEDKSKFMEVDSTDSKPSVVDRGTDSLRGLENGVKGEPVKVVRDKPGPPAVEPESSAEAPGLPPSPPLVKVKDEPIDEEYEQALVPSAPAGTIKDEPDTFEDFGQQQKASDDLKISAVFSVGGASTVNVPVPVAAPPSTALTPTMVPAPTIPPLIPTAMRVACSACKKVLMKGQTAYQRKGSSDLFCSTHCLTSHTPSPAPNAPPKLCHYCLKEIFNPKDVIIAPVDTTGTMKFFCSQNCLSSFDFKRNSAASTLSSTTGATSSKCSMCKKNCISKHEVILQGTMHRLCGEECFHRFRSSYKLTMNSCQQCASYCYGKVHQLALEGSTMTFCKTQCLATFKQKTKRLTPCTMCRTQRPVADMSEGTDSNGKTDLFCSPSCVTAHKVQTVSASGSPVDCNTCGKKTVPSYHLAMSDGSIRNFCTLGCVVTFQDQFNKSNTQSQANVQALTPAAPVAPAQSQTTTTPIPKGPIKLPCFQCHRLFSSKPEIIQFKEKVVFLCGISCSEQYRSCNAVIGRCEYCKIEKMTKEVKRINKKDCSFCSEGCKLLYKHDLAKRWGKHCRSCTYCSTTSQKVVTGQYGGRTEDFCSDECKSRYTLLFCQVAKCEACGRQGKLIETLPMLGEVKHFCNLKCLLHFCSQQTLNQSKSQQTHRAVSIAPSPVTTTAVGTMPAKEATPVIGNVVSLASIPTGQPNVFANTALQGAVPSAAMRILGNASTQTDVVKGPPPPPPRILKNKALLCKPMVQNKGVMCKPLTTTIETQTEDHFPKVIVLPIPVPVFVPVPMHLYSQYVPQPVGLPIPLPVPMFLPVTLENAERIVETIQEIKAKIPSNPFEADLILMAEMVAEEGREEKKGKEGRCKPAAVHEDQASSYSGDLDTEELTGFLNWEEEPTSSRLGCPLTNERLQPVTDNHVGAVPDSTKPPVMDLEADFPIETLELMAHWRDQSPSPPPPPSPQRRRPRRKARDSFPSKKRSRKSRAAAAETAAAETAAAETAAANNVPSDAVPGEPSKLQHMYGVDAWKRWVQWRSTQPDLEKPRFGSRQMVLKEDVLKCTTAELGYGLCRFICEVKRPNEEAYTPDSMFYLCLGIQQHLFENGRMENIFTDLFYGKFTVEITKLLKEFKPTITASGYLHSRVEEEYLWGCKQLGAYSPIVLLNTLLFFCTKLFHFKTVLQHRQLSFAHVMRCTKTNFDNTKTNFLRFYPPIPKGSLFDKSADADGVAAKRKREDEEKEVVLEMIENCENPLRCPVRLYEFYLSKCSESVKQRSNVFYLHPERSCVPNSPMWFSSTALDDSTMETMLTRILTVREIHLDLDGKDLPAPPDNDDEDWTG